ncbi:MAG: hypothetical protein LBU79_08445 [Planctomycetota bacterium]|jgi:hypothetical protein|nr:hypothetical protein [Planctomycetota bacterium]
MPRATHPLLTLLLLLALATGSQASGAGLLSRFRGNTTASSGMFPDSGSVPQLELTGRILTYRGNTFTDTYGTTANIYLVYGFTGLKSATYNYGGPDRPLVIEIAAMTTPDAAAGIFHHHTVKVLQNQAEDVAVGTEGALDTPRGGRTLYFYKSNLFVKIIYSGKTPIPDLLPVAQAVNQRIGGSGGQKPQGFNYIDIPGVDLKTVSVTPGNCFQIQELPPAVWASAPGGGSTASDLFIITRGSRREAARVARDYSAYVRLVGQNYDEYRVGKQTFWRGVDPQQGRVVFTSYRSVMIIAARPDGFDKGEELIKAVMRKIDAVDGVK